MGFFSSIPVTPNILNSKNSQKILHSWWIFVQKLPKMKFSTIFVETHELDLEVGGGMDSPLLVALKLIGATQDITNVFFFYRIFIITIKKIWHYEKKNVVVFHS
jgi:hypothetical protein